MPRNRKQIEAICSCGNKKIINCESYNKNITKNSKYLCHYCSTIKAGADGKYTGNNKSRSERSKKLWENNDFKTKVNDSCKKAWTTDKKRQASVDTKTHWEKGTYDGLSDKMKIVMASPTIRDRISRSLKLKYESDPEYKLKVLQSIINNPKQSSLQLKLYDYLDDLNIKYYKEGPDTVIGFYVFDCLIDNESNKKLLIECQGDYWHSLPKAKQNDKAKFTYINKYFPEYEIMYLWEHEFSAKDRVIDRLKLKLNVDINIVNFDINNVIIKRITASETAYFFDAYHYLGKGRGGICYGGYLEGQLIVCTVLSKPIRQNMGHISNEFIEISRFCIHPNYHKKNFASWFISRIVREQDIDIIAFSDSTVGHTGTIYKAANFKLHHEVNPDYWYVDAAGYVMHKKTLYNRSKKFSLSEEQFANKFGYNKKYGGPKLCWIYNKQK